MIEQWRTRPCGRVNVRLNSEEVFAQGEELRTDAGQAIPSSITYTDETGGDTTYVPLSYLSRLLDTGIRPARR